MARTAQKDICRLPDSQRLNMKHWIRFILSYQYFVTGDFKAAYAGACRSLDWYSRTETDIIMPLACLHAALPAYFLNEFHTGYGWAEKGLDLICEMGVRDNQEGWLNYAAALHLCGLNRLDQALARARKAMERFTHQTNYWGRAHVYDLISFIRLKQGDPGDAENNIEQGLTLLHGTGLTMTEGILETGMLRVWLETGRFDAVMENIAPVLEKVGASAFYTFKTRMISALCRLRMKDRDAALAELNQAVDIAAKYGYAHQMANTGPQIEDLLSALYSNGVRQGFIREVFNINHRAYKSKEQDIGLDMGVHGFAHSGFIFKQPTGRFISRMKELGTYVTSTLSCTFDQMLVQFERQRLDNPYLKLRVPGQLLETAGDDRAWQDYYDRFFKLSSPKWIPPFVIRALPKLINIEKSIRSCLQSASRAILSLYEAGIPIAAGTDASSWPVFPNFFHGTSMIREMELLYKIGIPPMNVISSATRVPAQMMGISDRIGTIEKGKYADMIVVREDPLENPTALESLMWTIKGGDARTPAQWMADNPKL